MNCVISIMFSGAPVCKRNTLFELISTYLHAHPLLARRRALFTYLTEKNYIPERKNPKCIILSLQ